MASEEQLIPDAELFAEGEELVERLEFTADRGQEPMRIDKYLMHKLERVSRSRVQQAAEAGCIAVAGKPVKSNYKVKAQDVITLILPRSNAGQELKPENIPLNIVYEDNEIIVINKPAGLVVHPGAGNYTGTLVNALLHHFGILPQPAGQETPRPGLVHRIDKDTTGLMVAAKTEYAMTHLAKQFYHHTVQRTYNALVWGDIKEEAGTITGHIGRNPRNRKLMHVFPEGETGKPAVTHYRVLERLGYVTLVECKLETGRTHQIRVHMKHAGYPLFNDNTYGGDRIVKGTVYTKYKQFVDNCFKLLPRQALHALTLGFEQPVTGKQLFFSSELPADMKAAIEAWRAYMGMGRE